jgi:NAD(P)-dependent dehydrogenase (short-subunit alcohol dehydrogenase family)
MSSDLSDRAVAVVTGASSGIGQAVVTSLLARGFFVVATMRRVTAAPSHWADNQNVAIQPLDVTSDESVAALAKWLRDDRNGKRCDVLVNNAGFGAPGTVETVPLDTAMRIFRCERLGCRSYVQGGYPDHARTRARRPRRHSQ